MLPLSHNDVPASLHHCHSVRIQQLTVSLANFTKLELEPALLVKDLYAVVVGVGHDDVVLGVDGDTTGLRELTLQDSKFSKLAVVDHLLTSDLGLGWIGDGSGWNWSCQ